MVRLTRVFSTFHFDLPPLRTEYHTHFLEVRNEHAQSKRGKIGVSIHYRCFEIGMTVAENMTSNLS